MMTPNPQVVPKILKGISARRHAVVEAKQASLSTMSVTIQALHVSGKQMTLSVFRQLPELDLYDPQHADGVMWGHVRYRIGGVDEWVVLQVRGSLARCNAVYKGSHHEFCLSCVQRAEAVWSRIPSDGTVVQVGPRLMNKDDAFEEVLMWRADLQRALRVEPVRQAIAQIPQLFIAV